MNAVKLRLYSAASITILLCGVALGSEIRIEALESFAPYVERRFGLSAAEVSPRDPKLYSLRPDRPAIALGTLDETKLGTASDRYRPRPLIQGYPLIQTKGMVKGGKYLYIADTGKDATHSEPARIWRLDPVAKVLTKLYEGPLLVNAKWLWFSERTLTREAVLVVSDYGVEPNPRSPGTGEGAKVLAFSIDAEGNAGPPRVLHQGPPLRSPEGVTVVGDTVVLSDWAAGPTTKVSDRPGEFNSGVVFSLPLTGGPPTRLFPEKTFITLIAACRYEESDGSQYVRLIDIDGGRPDASTLKYLPQSGLVAFYRFKVLSEKPFSHGSLESIPLLETSLVPIKITGISSDDSVYVRGLKDTRLNSSTNALSLSASVLEKDGTFVLVTTSNMQSRQVNLEVSFRSPGTDLEKLIGITIPKIDDEAIALRDNKHAGAATAFSSAFGARLKLDLAATADGTSGSVSLIPTRGGVPGVLWRGAPFVTPMATQFSWDGKKIWVTDQNAGPDGTSAVFEIDVPSPEEQLKMFPSLFSPGSP